MRCVTVLLLLAAGCSNAQLPTHYSVTVSSLFTADEQEAAVRGVDSWTSAVPALAVDVRVGECDGASICILPVEIGAGHAGREYGHETDRPTIGIDTTYAGSATLIQRTAAHEFGHVMMGPSHTAPGTLMAAFVEDQAEGPTLADVDRWRSMRGL